MEIFKNGFVVAEINENGFTYNAWPLSDIENDKIAGSLTNEADDNWFIKYDMQHIAPDLNYAIKYYNYCKTIELNVKVLLFKSLDNTVLDNDAFKTCETLGFDCIGTVYYSYLLTELNEFKYELLEKNIIPNKYGLLDNLEDVLYFIELRKKVIASGVNLEDFWEETPIKISIINPL